MGFTTAITILLSIFAIILSIIPLIKNSVKKTGCQQPNVGNTTKPPKKRISNHWPDKDD